MTRNAAMRGADIRQDNMFSYVSLDARVPKNHPLRAVRTLVDEALRKLSRRFEALYAEDGRPSIAPERLIRALLLQIFYSIRSERLLMEQLDYNLLFRWFVGLSADEPVWDASTFSKNRDRLLAGEIATGFFRAVLKQAQAAELTSDEHFSVDGTLIEAWASQKSFRRKDGNDDDASGGRNGEQDFRGQERANDTHASSTDPDCRLYRKSKGQEAKLCYAGHILMENRNGLVVNAELTPADGHAERSAALMMLKSAKQARTLGADRAYDTEEFIAALRERDITPHVAQNLNRRGGSAIDARTTRHDAYGVSQCIRKRVEEPFGWGKSVGPLEKTKLRGRLRVGFQFVLTMAAYNLIRLRGLLAPPLPA